MKVSGKQSNKFASAVYATHYSLQAQFALITVKNINHCFASLKKYS